MRIYVLPACILSYTQQADRQTDINTLMNA